MTQYSPQPIYDSFQSVEAQQEAQKAIHIYVPEPQIGCKVALIKERGLFVLERGQSSLIGMACTHAGSGGIIVYDGIPDDDGQFPDGNAKPENELSDEFFEDMVHKLRQDLLDNHQSIDSDDMDELYKRARKEYTLWYEQRNGREFYYAHPACMGMWMLNAGCKYGITILNKGSHDCSSPIVTITWMASKKKVQT